MILEKIQNMTSDDALQEAMKHMVYLADSDRSLSSTYIDLNGTSANTWLRLAEFLYKREQDSRTGYGATGPVGVTGVPGYLR